MKLNLFIMLFAVLHVSANHVTAQKARLDLKMKNASFASILDAIEQRSDVYFFYNKTQIDETRRLDVNFENKTVEEILNELGSDLQITYEISGKNIIIKSSESSIKLVSQQNRTVSGKVTDSSGQPLPGVTVVVKGTTQGTITDGDGNWSLPAVPTSATLVFSFVGMKSQELHIAGKTIVNVNMEEETVGLEEVIAIGYGVQKKNKFNRCYFKCKF